jgi:hypothetical protein
MELNKSKRMIEETLTVLTRVKSHGELKDLQNYSALESNTLTQSVTQ